MQIELNSNKREIDNLQKRIKELEELEAQKAEKIVNLQDESRIQQTRIGELERQLELKEEEIVNFQNSTRDQEQRIGELEEQLAQKAEEIGNLQINSKIQQKSAKEFKRRLAQKTKENASLEDNIKIQLESIKKFKMLLSIKDEEFSNLQNISRDQEQKSSELERQLAQKAEEIVNLQNISRGQEQKSSELERQLAQKAEEIVNLQNISRDQEQKNSELERHLTTKNEEVEEGKKEISNLETQLKRIQSNMIKSQEITFLDSDAIKKYVKRKKIGSGSNGTVYEVAKEETFVLKEMNHISTDSFRKLINEHELLCLLYHPNIIKTYGIYCGDETTAPSIILEQCSENIDEALKNNSISKPGIVFSIYQIAEAMKYLHFKNIIHRDLKPSNIVIAKDGTTKIIDFGLSRLNTTDSFSKTLNVGTLLFMAPEIINNSDYDEKVDVYSFGVLIFYILSGRKMPKITMSEISLGKKAQIPSEFTQFSKDLINSCWNFNPSQRPSFNDICNILKENLMRKVRRMLYT